MILAKVEEELKNNENRYINWLVFDVNPTRDILEQIAAMLVKAGFGSEEKKTTVEVEEMIQNVQKKGKRY